MPDLIRPVHVGYVLACGLLVGIAVVELFLHRRKQAGWDFVFAGFAIFCWLSVVGFLTVAVR